MAKDINLTSKQWNDIVFEGRPKDYGAYELRLSSTKRHIIAFLFIILLVVFVTFLPKLIETVEALRPAPDNLTEDTTLADLAAIEEQKIEELVQQTQVEPPPPLKSTIQFVAPVIVDDEDMTEDEQIKSQDELNASDTQISLFDVEGTDDELGVDKAELEEHQQAAGEGTGHIYDVVQQMPQFPGGDAELLKYLRDNIVYPTIAMEHGIQGTVTVRFAVMSDGSIGNITTISSPDRTLSDEAVRVIKSMPRFIPGMQNGKPVNVYFHVPVIFRLQ
jgi:protein TonB